MKIFLLSDKRPNLSIDLPRSTLALMLFCLLCLASVLFYTAFNIGLRHGGLEASSVLTDKVVSSWQTQIKDQKSQIKELSSAHQHHVDALTLRVGELQARLLRLDALGQRLTGVAGLDQGEFDFSSMPAVGGPESRDLSQSYSNPELVLLLETIEKQAESREQQLRLIDELIVKQKFQREKFIAGRPITKGWLSSYYGYRTDPFTGKRAWHSGVDFAGKLGSPIVAVAAGVVTEANKRSGYGVLVEVSHGAGLVTRYAHCKEATVSVGEVVQKGQKIATMGSTGRSTGPHVHFEVLKNNKTLNPIKFIQRASK